MRENESKLVVPNDTRYLALIGSYISHVARLAGFSGEEVEKIELAVDEACTNVIKHAYDPDTIQHFTVKVRYTDEELRIIVQDKGRPFDPALLESSLVLDKSVEGNMGLFIMKKVMDEVKFVTRKGGVKEFHLIKYRKKRDV